MSESRQQKKRLDDEKSAKSYAEVAGLLAKIVEALEKGFVELYNIELELDEVELKMPLPVAEALPIPIAVAPPPQKVVEAKPEIQAGVAVAKAVEVIAKKVVELMKMSFEEPKAKFGGKVVEVRMGATKSDGGTRDTVIVLGGHELPPYYYLAGYKPPHPPAFGGDTFDMRIGLPRAVRQAFGDALDNPEEWARVWVKKFGAEAIDIHLVSTDPTIKNASPEEAVKTVDKILQVVKVPIVVGGSGNPEKDVAVFNAVANAFPSEGLVINSLNLDMDLEKVCPNIAKTNAVVIDFSPMSVEKAEEINRKVYTWIPRNRIILDLNIGGIGYGTEYGFTTMERARLGALMGNDLLQHPFNVGAANAWGAREAWMTMDQYWGPKEIRGPLWETLTCVICLLAGADYFMVLHPLTMKVLKSLREYLFSEPKPREPEKALSWLSAKLPVV
ncbi:CO dehydrogenase/acetyl-CoA synthase subunit delta [Ignisphaera sp. 4213-co]|uniref:CO dehydrogenase/acetyl-CoA synthase subunit delta n=1 Tax=Ignisphaera cupida TaxID=3050454 RepID=A0ABD4Z881_9CREN|nr:CO dehydrogenase/acetyl-CoA synthase subunit delta [Ignisphaera sp. 4213-co]MDK6028773.1 CO dehydrogenase/acetyl-CoA synthase subunit delta [Ignisphaera sp. 4213-co]